MKRKGKVIAVVLAGGKGTRMGGTKAKQYLELGGKPILVHTLSAFAVSDLIDRIILVAAADYMEYVRTEIVEKYRIRKIDAIVTGGKERYESVWNALRYIEQQNPEENTRILIHDGARPFVTGEIIERCVRNLEEVPAICVGMPVKDTIKIVDAEGNIAESPDRSLVWQAQTPQGFEATLILKAFHKLMEKKAGKITDDAMVVEQMTGEKVRMVLGDYTNIKITTPEDMIVAERFLADM